MVDVDLVVFVCAYRIIVIMFVVFFFFSSRRRHTRFDCDWSSDVCSSDLSGRRAAVVRDPSAASNFVWYVTSLAMYVLSNLRPLSSRMRSRFVADSSRKSDRKSVV